MKAYVALDALKTRRTLRRLRPELEAQYQAQLDLYQKAESAKAAKIKSRHFRMFELQDLFASDCLKHNLNPFKWPKYKSPRPELSPTLRLRIDSLQYEAIGAKLIQDFSDILPCTNSCEPQWRIITCDLSPDLQVQAPSYQDLKTIKDILGSTTNTGTIKVERDFAARHRLITGNVAIQWE